MPTGMPLLDSHLSALTLRAFRPTTIKARRAVLLAFAREVAPRQLAEVTRLDVESYLSRPLAPESRRTYRAHLRSFYAWCVDEGFLHDDPTAKVPTIKVRRGVPRPLSDAELERALALADRRMRAWLLAMALAGLRCMEVAALRPTDLAETPSGALLHLRVTKGGAPATVPCHPALLDALAAVPIRNGLWWDLTAGTLSAAVNRHLRAAGVPGTAHALRHWAGTSWYRASGHDLLTTAALLRHTSVDTTSIYAQVSPERPHEVARAVGLRAV
ncbi:MAG TPA: tyrosine-type recombinase/integrase [Pilimelia sp.]|nr:tyrosine-type recombinase/integrase [Pilimelia sp.]